MNTKNSNERSLMPLMLTSVAVSIPLIFILGLVVGNQLLGNSSLTGDSISSWLSAMATVAIAILTFILAKETWSLREAQTQQLEELKRENIRPDIGIQLNPNPVGFNLFDVKITNHGKGIAKKILIKFLDRQGNEVQEEADIVVSEFRKLAMFRLGIQTMGIGQEISSFVFNFHELSEKLQGDIFSPFINMSINFEDVTGYSYSNSFTIDFAQFQGMSEVGGNSIYKLSNEIKKIREILERATRRNGGRVSVDMFSSKDREAEAEADRQWIENQRKNGD